MARNKEDSQLDSVTDVAKEAELDKQKCMKALAELAKMEQAKAQENKNRRKELKAVQVNEDDVTYLVDEFLITKSEADSILRLNNGDLSETLKKLMEPKQQKRLNVRPNILY